jgi:hypothetical protein
VDKVHDNVNNPSHYTHGDIEAIDFILDQDMNYCIGNAVKYLVRYRWKHEGEGQIEDLRKAIKNIQKQIDKMIDQNIK